MNPSLHSSKISLRAPEPEDIDEMMFFENDASFWENGPATGPYSRYQLKKYIAENQNDLFADGQLRLMIEHASGEVAGIIVVKPAYRRQGIAFEALCLLEQHCFGLLGIHQLYAYIRSDNTASFRLFKKLGYSLTGTLKDWVHTGEGYRDVYLMQKLATQSVQSF